MSECYRESAGQECVSSRRRSPRSASRYSIAARISSHSSFEPSQIGLVAVWVSNNDKVRFVGASFGVNEGDVVEVDEGAGVGFDPETHFGSY